MGFYPVGLEFDPLYGSRVLGRCQNHLVQYMVMLNINLKGNKHRIACYQYFELTHALEQWGGAKGIFMNVVMLYINLKGKILKLMK